MEAGLSGALASEHLTFEQLFGILAPYYLSIGMPVEDFWNGEPGLAPVYAQAEVFRARERQRELFYEGIYMQRAIQAALSKDAVYFKEPLPITEEEVKDAAKRRQQEDLERVKAGFKAWAKLPCQTGKGGQL